MSLQLIEMPNKTGTLYGKDRPAESYKLGDTLYFKNLNGRTSYGKLFGFRRELIDYNYCRSCKRISDMKNEDSCLSFMVKGLTGEVNEVFLNDVVFSFSRKEKVVK